MNKISFRQFLLERDETPRLKSPSKSIEYLEDLDIKDFIDAMKNINQFKIGEKLDGTALKFGFDNNGKFYTTRSGKGSNDKLNYLASDYGVSGAANGMKAAHQALKKNIDTLEEYVKPGEAIDIEILFGRQPNTVVYGVDGYNFIAFLKASKGTDESANPDQSIVTKLGDALNDTVTTVRTVMVDSPDGVDLVKSPQVTTWKFVTTHFVDTQHLEDVNLNKHIKALENYLDRQNEVAESHGLDMTNYEVVKAPLTKFDKSIRAEMKDERASINDNILNNFKLPIKQEILDKFVRQLKPTLQAKNVTKDEDTGIEGLVFLDPKTQRQFKVVDKDVFQTLNKFNYEARNQIRGIVKTDEPDAPASSRGGLFGEAKIRIANLFDIPGLGRANNVKKIVARFKGDSPEDTIKNFAHSVHTLNFMAIRHKISAILKSTLDDLDTQLSEFKEDYPNYKVKLNSGKEVGYSAEIVRRTLLVFAETRQQITDLRKQILKSHSIEDIIAVLFGRQIQSLFDKSIDTNEE